MKKEFAKFFGVGFALVLALSLSLVTAVPVAAGDYGPEVTVPFGFSAEGRPELSDGSVSLVGEDLIIEFTAMGQNAKPEETNKYAAIWFDVNIEDKDLSTAAVFDQPYDEGNYVLVYNWYKKDMTDKAVCLSWRPSYYNPDPEKKGYENPWGSPVPSPTTIFFGAGNWPTDLSFDYEIIGEDDIKWTATVPTSLLGVEAGDTFGVLVSARDENTDLDPKSPINSWPTNVYGFWGAGNDLRDYALVTIPNTVVVTTVQLDEITAINVEPTSIDFGTIKPGEAVSGDDITVENIGTVIVDVSAALGESGTVFEHLKLADLPLGSWPEITGLAGGGTAGPITTLLDVPRDYSAKGVETNTLIFTAQTAS